MRTRHSMTGTVELMSQTEADIGVAMTSAMRAGTTALVEDWRATVEAARLGTRLANTVRGRTFPDGRTSLDPTSWAWTKAPKIIDAYATGVTIVPGKGRFLAIPTLDVPRQRQGDPLTPTEVEARFNRRLQFISPRDKGFHTPSIRSNGVAFLVLKDLVVRKATGRWRNASERELARGRSGQKALSAVIMFILVPQVRVAKRLDLEAVAARAQARFQPLLDLAWSSIPDRTAKMKGPR